MKKNSLTGTQCQFFARRFVPLALVTGVLLVLWNGWSLARGAAPFGASVGVLAIVMAWARHRIPVIVLGESFLVWRDGPFADTKVTTFDRVLSVQHESRARLRVDVARDSATARVHLDVLGMSARELARLRTQLETLTSRRARA